MPDPVHERDEARHEHGDEPGWSERLSFCFFDAASGFAGIARVEFHPLDGRADGSLNMFIPGDALATVLTRAKLWDVDQWSVGRILLEQEEPLARWRVRCADTALILPTAGASGLAPTAERRGMAAPVELDLRFESWMPPAGQVSRTTEVDDQKFVRVTSGGHFEQAGRVAGSIRVGNRKAEMDAVGIRDKSWGAPDPTATHSSRWIAVAFGADLAFGVRGVSLGGRDMRSGWVARPDGVRAVKGFHLETEYEGRSVRALRLQVTDATGERYDLSGEAVASAPLREGGARVRQVIARFRAGDREALGLYEDVEGR